MLKFIKLSLLVLTLIGTTVWAVLAIYFGIYACKYTNGGEVTFTVMEEKMQDASWIVFKVSDTGIGMSKEQVDKVFDAFTQADNSTTRKYGGTGLGLTISKRFCEMMGGSISIESVPAVGSVFIVKLPAEIGY